MEIVIVVKVACHNRENMNYNFKTKKGKNNELSITKRDSNVTLKLI